MKAFEIMDKLFGLAKHGDFSNTCDTCKAGDPNAEVDKVAVSMFATPDVIKNAKAWGAQLLIVHEPTYYNHMDTWSDEKIETEKRKLIEESGLTLYRYHDHAHYTVPDVIAFGELKQLGLEGEIEYTDVFDLVRLRLREPLTPLALAEKIEKRLGISHVRIAGTRDAECSLISLMFGAPGGVFGELKREESEIVLTGEACEWCICEYARDAAQLGHKKALIVMGHIGSERDGMKYTVDLLNEIYPELNVRYFECGEVYSYTDSRL